MLTPPLPLSLDRLVGLIGELPALLRSLPGMADDVAAMARHTAVLSDVSEHTSVLPQLHKDMTRVADSTDLIAQIDARMATIEAAMPVLVEVQRHLATLPEALGGLDGRLDELALQLAALQHALEPIGLVVQRVPGQRRAARRALQAEHDAQPANGSS